MSWETKDSYTCILQMGGTEEDRNPYLVSQRSILGRNIQTIRLPKPFLNRSTHLSPVNHSINFLLELLCVAGGVSQKLFPLPGELLRGRKPCPQVWSLPQIHNHVFIFSGCDGNKDKVICFYSLLTSFQSMVSGWSFCINFLYTLLLLNPYVKPDDS